MPTRPQEKNPTNGPGRHRRPFTRGKYNLSEKHDQATRAMEMQMAGATVEQIATTLKIGKGTVYARLEQAYESMRPHADFDEYRAKQMAEINLMRKQLLKIIATWQPRREQVTEIYDRAGNRTGTQREVVPVSPQNMFLAMDRLMRLEEREAKLLGLDRVPTPFDEIAALSDDELERYVMQKTQELEDQLAAERDWEERYGIAPAGVDR